MSRFSVVIPCYNCRETLARAISSVSIQSELVRELIIIDDCSCDTIDDILADFKAEHFDIIYRRLKKNMGPGYARNLGVQLANAEFIALLDSDDFWLDGKLRAQATAFDARPDIEVLGTTDCVNGSQSNTVSVTDNVYISSYTLIDFLISNRVSTRSVAFRSSCSVSFGSRDTAEDYYAWLQYLVNSNKCIHRLEQQFCVAGRPEYSKGGYSGDLWRHELREITAIYKNLSKFKIVAILLLPAIIFSILKFIRRLVLRTMKI